MLLGFLGFAFSLANWLAMLAPIFLARRRRMQAEEDALSAALGEKFVSYMRRTKWLVPGLYQAPKTGRVSLRMVSHLFTPGARFSRDSMRCARFKHAR